MVGGRWGIVEGSTNVGVGRWKEAWRACGQADGAGCLDPLDGDVIYRGKDLGGFWGAGCHNIGRVKVKAGSGICKQIVR